MAGVAIHNTRYRYLLWCSASIRMLSSCQKCFTRKRYSMNINNTRCSIKVIPEFPTDDAEWIKKVHSENYIKTWAKQGMMPRVIKQGKGSWFQDDTGKWYLDFESQLVNLNLGHQHPKIIQAIKDQADRMCYIGPGMGVDVRSELSAIIEN